MNDFLCNHVAHTFGHSFSTFIKIWRFIQINSSFIGYIFWAALFTKIILTIHIGIFDLSFHRTTIKSYMVYRYIMLFPFLFSVENVCPLCHKSFKKNYLMKKHFELIHEGKKSYQCHQCAHLFATKAGLIHHQQHVHEGIKFHCQVCRNNAAIPSGGIYMPAPTLRTCQLLNH